MSTEDVNEMKQFRNWILSIMVGLVVLGMLATGASRMFGLAWFPWEVSMQTAIVRNSNGFVSTQISALRELRVGYESATTPGQKAALLAQMHDISDKVSEDYVPTDIRAFLSTH